MEKPGDTSYSHDCCACVPILWKACAEKDAIIATITTEFASLTAKYQALDRMFTHAGIVKAQEVHNQMVAERDGIIDDLRERMAALEGELLGTQDANKKFRITIAELREALAQAHNAAGA